jgi:hypothetical protein
MELHINVGYVELVETLGYSDADSHSLLGSRLKRYLK